MLTIEIPADPKEAGRIARKAAREQAKRDEAYRAKCDGAYRDAQRVGFGILCNVIADEWSRLTVSPVDYNLSPVRRRESGTWTIEAQSGCGTVHVIEFGSIPHIVGAIEDAAGCVRAVVCDRTAPHVCAVGACDGVATLLPLPGSVSQRILANNA